MKKKRDLWRHLHRTRPKSVVFAITAVSTLNLTNAPIRAPIYHLIYHSLVYTRMGRVNLFKFWTHFCFVAVRRVAFDQLYGAWHVKVISWSKIECIRANIDNMMTFTPLVTIWMFIFYSSNFLFPESINVVKLWLVPLIGKSLFRQFSNLLNICTVHVHLAYICFVNRARFFAY